MPALRQQIRLCSRAQWIMAATACVLVAGFYLVGYRPTTRRLETLRKLIDESRNQITLASAQTRRLPAVAAELGSLREQLSGSKSLSHRSEIALFLKEIAELGQRASLKLDYKQPDEMTANTLFAQQQIKLKFQGSFASVFSFLRQTESMRQLTRTKSLLIRSEESAPGQVSVEMAMNIYFTSEDSGQ
jgi:Tfp pilus assembly protein PilO